MDDYKEEWGYEQLLIEPRYECSIEASFDTNYSALIEHIEIKRRNNNISNCWEDINYLYLTPSQIPEYNACIKYKTELKEIFRKKDKNIWNQLQLL